ncbi:hypothetical protein LINGRAHAP2_LOCUS31608 [Linum grandiflorum]
MHLRTKPLQPKCAEDPSDVTTLLIECQHKAVLLVTHFTNNMEMPFLARLVKSSFWHYLAGEDHVEFVAEKDSEFRRTYR